MAKETFSDLKVADDWYNKESRLIYLILALSVILQFEKSIISLGIGIIIMLGVIAIEIMKLNYNTKIK